MEEKKNTDCVYFLASPLTCKKGMQCEFRHSEVARLNPRDCWYWLSGNCLNPDCPFRHPPLDAAEEETPRIPCYFYSQGYCAKGDQCAFVHGYARHSTSQQQHQKQQPSQTQTQSLVAAASQTVSSTALQSTPKHSPGKTNPCAQRNGNEKVQRIVPDAEVKPQHHPVVDHAVRVESSSSPTTQNEQQQEKSDSGEKSDDARRFHDWPMRGDSSPDFDDGDPVAQQDLYSDDGGNYDAVLDPVNGSSQLMDHHSHRQLLQPASSYDYACGYDPNGGAGVIRESFEEYQPYDPPYHPSPLPHYDCLINPSRQPLVQEQRIDPDLEALLMARNLDGLSRGRLEDRLVFPRGNHRSLFATNRLKLFNGNSVHSRLAQDSLNGHQRSGLWKVANGGTGSVHSRLGSSKPSVKSRLKYAANQRLHHRFRHQHHYQFQQQHHHNHQYRNFGRNSRYLGVVPHWKHHKAAKRSKLGAAAAAAATGKNAASKTATATGVNLKESQFDGPKSLAELKAAKEVEAPGS